MMSRLKHVSYSNFLIYRNWRTHSCSIFCKDRSDSKFKCDDDDGYKCAPGYSGPNCDKGSNTKPRMKTV